MFRRTDDEIDLSLDLRDEDDLKPAVLHSFDFATQVTALAADPIIGLLAFGTKNGVVRVFGGQGVEASFKTPGAAVKFLHFSSCSDQLACLDSNNQLHVWDLSVPDGPKATAKFDQVYSMTVSPSHHHAFLSMESGEVRTYDLTCHRKSEYTIPNLWKLYEEGFAAERGVKYTPDLLKRVALDVVHHPRDLNLLFVVYAGGVVLTDLTQRSTVCVYEYKLPSGALGGSSSHNPIVQQQRTPGVTCFAVHPSGHIAVIGYEDGSMAFWAVDEPSQPLLTRTLDDIDVNVPGGSLGDEFDREPIFKLSWSGFSNSSDPRGGETALVILGGLVPVRDPSGLTVHWLPPFNPPAPPTTPDPQPKVHPSFITAMRAACEATNEYRYATTGIVQDYLLIPADTPHFSGAFDAKDIIIVSEGTSKSQFIEAYQFPPPAFLTAPDSARSTNTATSMDSETGALHKITSALRGLEISDEPKTQQFPSVVWNAGGGVTFAQLVDLSSETYQRLTEVAVGPSELLQPHGGVSWTDDTQEGEVRMARYQPPRHLISSHQDGTVRFYDMSTSLLIGSPEVPIQHSFPNLIPSLTLDLNTIFQDATVLLKLGAAQPLRPSIHSVYFASEAIECTVVLESGDIVVFRLTDEPPSYPDSQDGDLIPLSHLPRLGLRFSPLYLLTSRGRRVSACALSDIGFMAAAYQDGSVLVVDARIPKVIVRQGSVGKNRHSLHIGSATADYVSSLYWTISPLGPDPKSGLHLIALSHSGKAVTITVGRVNNAWTAIGESAHFDAVTAPFASFVIDAKTGAERKADRSHFGAIMSGESTSRTFFVSVGEKGAKVTSNITGDRLGRVEWGSKVSQVQAAQIVTKLGACLLAVVTDNQDILTYSLPRLEPVHRSALPTSPTSILTIDKTGDFFALDYFLEAGVVQYARYGTLFSLRRINLPPETRLLNKKRAIPAQPQPVSLGPASIIGSWFTLSATMTGDKLDELLGGPNRPIPAPRPQAQAAPSSFGGVAGYASSVAAAATAAQGSVYERMSNALSERGQALGQLEDSFNSLEQNSSSMVSQAKRLAAQQTAKGWFGF